MANGVNGVIILSAAVNFKLTLGFMSFSFKNISFCFLKDGEWSGWSDYSDCSCQPQVGIGSKSKNRTCNMPAEENGGDFCTPMENNAVDNSSGTQIETQTDPCPCPVSK